MGLDAVVYKSAKTVLPKVDVVESVRIDDITGEVYSPTGLPALRPEDVVAVHKRLGNSSLVAELCKEIAQHLGSVSSLLIRRVLYSGSHSGDAIGLDQLDRLVEEIALLRKDKTQLSLALCNFMGQMDDLITAAREQSNPIVFV